MEHIQLLKWQQYFRWTWDPMKAWHRCYPCNLLASTNAAPAALFRFRLSCDAIVAIGLKKTANHNTRHLKNGVAYMQGLTDIMIYLDGAFFRNAPSCIWKVSKLVGGQVRTGKYLFLVVVFLKSLPTRRLRRLGLPDHLKFLKEILSFCDYSNFISCVLRILFRYNGVAQFFQTNIAE